MTARTAIFAVSTIAALICTGCQSTSNAKSTSIASILGDPLITAVFNGTISKYPNVPIGKAFEASFANRKWETKESKKGVKFVEFTGTFSGEPLAKSEAISKAIYDECAQIVKERREEMKQPNYEFIRSIGVTFLTKPVVHYGDARDDSSFWKDSWMWNDMMRMAEEKKGNESSIAELYNTTADVALVAAFGKIGPGNAAFDRFVNRKLDDVSVCSAENGNSVLFQFTFPVDGTAFSLSYIEMTPWNRIKIGSHSEVLRYVFE